MSDVRSGLNNLTIINHEQWFHTELSGEVVHLPIVDQDAAERVIFDFTALFPIFQAASDRLLGRPDRFQTYFEQFWSWHEACESESTGEEPDSASLIEASAEADETAIEGGFKNVFRRHRLREKRLRKAKIRQALRLGNGRLSCEVPGCGFDFFEVYGELGRHFAIVHHKKPLSDRTEPELTKLEDLAIVCANCHEMIHRRRQSRGLDDLIVHPAIN